MNLVEAFFGCFVLTTPCLPLRLLGSLLAHPPTAHLVLIPIDGASINPARSFATALTNNEWSDHWCVCPLDACVIGCLG